MSHTLSQTTRVWLCDLTYTQQTIASDIMPAGVGGIATYLEKTLASPVETRLFKHPEKLIAALESAHASGVRPHVVAFSNYIWNRDLSSQFAGVIKRKMPDVITVLGGPNYPTDATEQEEFCRDHDMIDFFVVWEGEIAFAKLVHALIECDFDVSRVPDDVPSIHRILPDGSFQRSLLIERLTDITEIPSPYTSGKMDEFFDGVLLPIIQTKRGCPFKCTFCVEGNDYYSRVAKTEFDKTDKDIRYICEKMAKLIAEGNGRTDMHISDSNFGMFKDDLDTCQTIGEMQKKYGYPEYINVATGKNHKERVLDAARLINGALRLSGAVQSLDKQVLENIKRDNIDEQGLMSLALEASDIGANSYSEIILGLPGDTLTAHFETIKKVIEADFNNLCLYQLMLLPGTDLASAESKKKWKMVTRFRALPRCYGYYDCLGEEINAAEIEEISVSNSSLSFSDYLDCRRFHLVANVFYNDGVFKEVLRLLSMLNLSKFDWIEKIYAYKGNADFNSFVETFLNETANELWEDLGEAEAFIRSRENLKKYVAGEFGANLIFKYRSIALVKHVGAMADVASQTIREYLEETGNEHAQGLAMELIRYAKLRMTDFLVNLKSVSSDTFNFAVDRFANDLQPENLDDYRMDEPKELIFSLSADQQKTMSTFIKLYGDNFDGYSRILAKVYMRRLFRSCSAGGSGMSKRERVIGDGRMSGLNEFG